jgi:flavin reductase (DIM6/NTAB) family NADH-FMN oxidoreductase RutF
VLSGTLGYVDCILEVEHDAGDHTIAVGRGVEIDGSGEGGPLLFFQGGYGGFEAP